MGLSDELRVVLSEKLRVGLSCFAPSLKGFLPVLLFADALSGLLNGFGDVCFALELGLPLLLFLIF